MKGKKTATCGSLWSYEFEKVKPLEKGDLSIFTDYFGEKACVAENHQHNYQKIY